MTSERQEIVVNLRDVFGFLAGGAIVALLAASAAGYGMYALSTRQPAVFEAASTLLVARSPTTPSQLGVSAVTAPPIDLGAYRVAAASDAVLSDALRNLGTTDPNAADIQLLRESVGSATEAGVRDSSLLRIEARRPTPEDAVAVANAVANALVGWDQRRSSESIQRVVTTLELQIEALSEQIRTLQTIGDGDTTSQIDGLTRLRAEQQQQLGYARALIASAEGFLSVLQPADSGVLQIAPRPVLNAAVAALLAVLLVYGLLLLRSALNTRLRSSDDIVATAGIPILAEYASASRPGDARLREASSFLRTRLLFATGEAHPRVFMVTSSSEAEGKTTVARNLAEAFVRYGYHTLLVDADLRAPSIADHYDIGAALATGTTTEAWLHGIDGPQRFVGITLGSEERLDVIPQLRPVPNASELLGRGFREALAHWQDYDVIVIDTPPVLAVSDTLTIAPHCTGTILVVDKNRSDRRKLATAVSALRHIGVDVVGIVANRVTAQDVGAGYGSAYAPTQSAHGSTSAAASTRNDPPSRRSRDG